MALTGYITAYVTKAEKRAMQDMFAELSSLSSTGTTLYKKLWKFALIAREVGQHEGYDQVTGNHFHEDVHYVNASLPYKRNRKLKNYAQLLKMNPKSTDMYAPSLIDVHYPNRPDRQSSMCLHDFVAYIDLYARDR